MIAESGKRADKIDARTLADLLWADLIERYYVPPFIQALIRKPIKVE
jgi:hypothetical protein